MTGERVVRRLAAILAADVVGYSRLMGRDENDTLARLKAHRTERLEPVLARHGGRLVKLAGDGALIEFPSAVNAVSAAIEFQEAMAKANKDQPAETAIIFRIGLHLGDLIVDGGDLYGDGVNVAARLEGEAPPGGILISRNVRDAVAGRVKATFEDLGGLSLKNIERPVRTFRVRWDPAAWPEGAAAPSTGSVRERVPRPTLAVLPFDNMGGDTEMEVFCDGLAEDLITALSTFRWVHLISRKSSFAYKGDTRDVRRVAQELGATYVVEGSVRRTGSRVRINVQLLEAHGGTHTRARRYDRELGNPFELQDEIVRQIAGSLDYVLWYGMVRTGEAADPQVNPLLAAAWHATRLTPEGSRLAITYARRVLEQNPHHVAALGFVTYGHVHDVLLGWSRDFGGDTAAALEVVRQAVALNPALSMSVALFGQVLAMARDRDNALSNGRRALALDSHSTGTLASTAALLSLAGDPAEANNVIARVLDSAPAHFFRPMFIAYTALNWLRLDAPERGLPYAEEAAKLKLEAPAAHVQRAALFSAVGRTEDARAALAAALAVRPDLDWAVVDAMIPYSDPADAERLHQALRAAGLRDGKT